MIAVSNIEFLEAMFADIPDDAAAMLCGFPGCPYDDTGDRKWKWFARPWCHGKPLPIRVSPNANNYLAVSSFGRTEAGEYRRRKDQFRRLHAVMIDDIGTKIAAARLRLLPSARIETSPANYQDFLFIEPTAAADDAVISARLIDQLVAKGLTADGRDPGMTAVTRYGRLPVGINGKAKYVEALGHPFRTRIVQWAPERRYTVERIAQAFALELAPPPARDRAPLSADIAETRMAHFDAMMKVIAEAGLYQETRGGWHHIECPWSDQHTDRAISGTAIAVPSSANNWAGGFRCHHGHCKERTIKDVYHFAREFQRALKGCQ